MIESTTVDLQPHELLRLWRERAGLTQWQAASLLGISQTALCELEKGHREPSVELLARATAVYGRRQ